MKLYYNPGSCSLAPHIVLRELDLPFELVFADMATHTLADGTDYRTIHPNGYVPLLVLDDGEQLAEGPAILQYIADRVPQRQLVPPAGTLARYHAQEWLNFIATELNKGYGLFYMAGMPESAKQLARAQLVKRLTWVDSRLGHQPYLMGEAFTVSDPYLYTVLRWSGACGVDISGSRT